MDTPEIPKIDIEAQCEEIGEPWSPVDLATRARVAGGIEATNLPADSAKHGTACAEVVHDVAPGAQLYLVNFDTSVEFLNAMDWLIARAHDLKRDTLSVVQDIYEYLEVDKAFEPDVSRKNVGGLPKNNALNSIFIKIRRNNVIKSITPDWLFDFCKLSYNKNLVKKIELPQDVRNKLIYIYKEDILKVQGLIQRDLKYWLPPRGSEAILK